MTKIGRNLPKELADHWPEVFEEVKLNVLPLRYLHSILISFKDGKSWEIKITQKLKKDGWSKLEETISELIKSYEHVIVDIDIKLDILQVKKDIEKKTKKFLKTKIQ